MQEEKAVLLCSLLLGFGLDAWACLGTNQLGMHPWVLTRSSHHAAVLWDPCSGKIQSKHMIIFSASCMADILNEINHPCMTNMELHGAFFPEEAN